MKIEMNKEQYLSLLKALAVASWVSSAVVESEEDVIVDFEPLEQYIMSKHKEFGIEDGEEVFFDKDNNLYFPTQDFEDEIMPIIDVFEDTSFWEELTHRLARRDLLEKHGEKTTEEMDPLARMGMEEEFLVKYSEEFSQFGVHRLRVIGD
jgi:hypothetical protein